MNEILNSVMGIKILRLNIKDFQNTYLFTLRVRCCNICTFFVEVSKYLS